MLWYSENNIQGIRGEYTFWRKFLGWAEFILQATSQELELATFLTEDENPAYQTNLLYHIHTPSRLIELPLKVLWRSGVINWLLCSQNGQADRVRSQEELHHLSIMIRGRGLGLVSSISAIQALGAKMETLNFSFMLVLPTIYSTSWDNWAKSRINGYIPMLSSTTLSV